MANTSNKPTALVFADDVERAGWFAVYAATQLCPEEAADQAVVDARSRCGDLVPSLTAEVERLKDIVRRAIEASRSDYRDSQDLIRDMLWVLCDAEVDT